MARTKPGLPPASRVLSGGYPTIFLPIFRRMAARKAMSGFISSAIARNRECSFVSHHSVKIMAHVHDVEIER
jgi:hypothetical protein